MIDLRPASVCGPILASEIFIYILKKKKHKILLPPKDFGLSGKCMDLLSKFYHRNMMMSLMMSSTCDMKLFLSLK